MVTIDFLFRGDDFYMVVQALSTERLRVKSNGEVTLSGTGSLKVPVGTTGERLTPAAGMFRYNTTEGKFEGYTTEWGEIGGGGGLTTAAHVANNAVVTLDLTAAQDHSNTNTGICVDYLYWWYRGTESYCIRNYPAVDQQLVSALTSCSHQVTHQC